MPTVFENVFIVAVVCSSRDEDMCVHMHTQTEERKTDSAITYKTHRRTSCLNCLKHQSSANLEHTSLEQ